MREVVMPHRRSAYEDLSQAADGAALLVSHPLTVTLPLVAQRRGLPWVATVCAPELHVFLRPAGPRRRAVAAEAPCSGADALQAGVRPSQAQRAGMGGAASRLPPGERTATVGTHGDVRRIAPRRSATWRCSIRNSRASSRIGRAMSALRRGRIRRCCAGPPAIRDELEHFLAEGEPPIVFALGSSAVWIAGDFWTTLWQQCGNWDDAPSW